MSNQFAPSLKFSSNLGPPYFREAKCSFNGYAWKSESDKQAFFSLFLHWAKSLKPESTTLGYIAKGKTGKTGNEENPTFPPTSLRCQTYNYTDPAHPGTTYPGSDKNMLLYLQMIKDRPFPTDDTLPNLGNFIRPGQHGVLCIGKGVIFDDFLLRDPESSLAPPNTLLSNYNERSKPWQNHGVDGGVDFPDWRIGSEDPSGTAWQPSTEGWKWSKEARYSDRYGSRGGQYLSPWQHLCIPRVQLTI